MAQPQAPLDVEAITDAVLQAAAEENAVLGTTFFPSAARCVADDTPNYPLYGHCTRLLIRQLANAEASKCDQLDCWLFDE